MTAKTKKKAGSNVVSIVPDAPIALADVLNEIKAALPEFLVLPTHGAVAITLWSAHTHALQAAEHSPLLAFMAPDRECGKTRGLEVVSELVRSPLPTSNASSAAIYRSLGGEKPPTLLIDEVDSFLNRRDDEIRNVLNSGHARANAFVLRCTGDDHEAHSFETWGAKAMAGIGSLPDTLASRSIIIPMRRRLPHETVGKLRNGRARLKQLGEQLGKALAPFGKDFPEAPAGVLDKLGDRDADNWEPLLSIAEAAGGAWPSLAGAAASTLSNGMRDKPASMGEMLLRDIRDIFDKHSKDAKGNPTRDHAVARMHSDAIIKELVKMEGRLWPEFSHNREMTANALALLLAKYGIVPGDVRAPKNLKGYKREWFSDAWARYLGDASEGEKGGDCRSTERDKSRFG